MATEPLEEPAELGTVQSNGLGSARKHKDGGNWEASSECTTDPVLSPSLLPPLPNTPPPCGWTLEDTCGQESLACASEARQRLAACFTDLAVELRAELADNFRTAMDCVLQVVREEAAAQAKTTASQLKELESELASGMQRCTEEFMRAAQDMGCTVGRLEAAQQELAAQNMPERVAALERWKNQQDERHMDVPAQMLANGAATDSIATFGNLQAEGEVHAAASRKDGPRQSSARESRHSRQNGTTSPFSYHISDSELSQGDFTSKPLPRRSLGEGTLSASSSSPTLDQHRAVVETSIRPFLGRSLSPRGSARQGALSPRGSRERDVAMSVCTNESLASSSTSFPTGRPDRGAPHPVIAYRPAVHTAMPEDSANCGFSTIAAPPPAVRRFFASPRSSSQPPPGSTPSTNSSYAAEPQPCVVAAPRQMSAPQICVPPPAVPPPLPPSRFAGQGGSTPRAPRVLPPSPLPAFRTTIVTPVAPAARSSTPVKGTRATIGAMVGGYASGPIIPQQMPLTYGRVISRNISPARIAGDTSSLSGTVSPPPPPPSLAPGLHGTVSSNAKIAMMPKSIVEHSPRSMPRVVGVAPGTNAEANAPSFTAHFSGTSVASNGVGSVGRSRLVITPGGSTEFPLMPPLARRRVEPWR